MCNRRGLYDATCCGRPEGGLGLGGGSLIACRLPTEEAFAVTLPGGAQHSRALTVVDPTPSHHAATASDAPCRCGDFASETGEKPGQYVQVVKVRLQRTSIKFQVGGPTGCKR